METGKMSGKPNLKVGILSDVQGYAYKGDWGMHNCENVLKFLAEKQVDVILMAGDLADGGDDPAPIAYYYDLVKKYFGNKMPQLVNCAGNHDFWTHANVSGKTQDQAFKDFCEAIHDPVEDPCRKTIGGYDFIGFSSNNEKNYSEEDCQKLIPVLEDCVRRDPVKPIFIVTHFHPKNTVVSSHGGSGRTGLRAVMDRFPQVVSFSGHTHCPLEDERCIWQGEFTAINTGALSYACVPERFVNNCGPIIPFAREGIGFMTMDLYDDHLEIRRFNAEDLHEIKADKPWTVAIPHKPENAVYTDARKAQRSAPRFRDDAQMLMRLDYGFVYLIFDEAEHDDFTHSYRLTMTDLESGKVMETKYISNFYRLERNRDPRQVFRIPPNTLEKGKRYRFDVYPVETFGNEGTPLTLEADIPVTYPFANREEIGPQE